MVPRPRALAVVLAAFGALAAACGREPCPVCGCRPQGEDRVFLIGTNDGGPPPDGGDTAAWNVFCRGYCASGVRCSPVTTDAGQPAVLCPAPIICID